MTRLAIVGYGNIAPKHIEVFRALGCQIVASVNKSPQRREQAMREGGIPAAYASLEEMLDRERPDGVICCPSFDQIFPVAKELAPRKVRVNSINPGFTITEGVHAANFVVANSLVTQLTFEAVHHLICFLRDGVLHLDLQYQVRATLQVKTELDLVTEVVFDLRDGCRKRRQPDQQIERK